MIVNFLKKVSLTRLILIFFIGVISWLPFFFFPLNVSFDYAIPPVRDFFQQYVSPQAFYIIILVFVIIQALYAVRLNYKYILVNQPTYMPALIFIILSVFFATNPDIVGALISNLFWMICVDILFNQAVSDINIKSYSTVGVLLAIGAFFFWPVIALIPIIWIISFVINSRNLRGLFSVLTTFVAVWLLYFYISFFLDDLESINIFFNSLFLHKVNVFINQSENLICPSLFIFAGVLSFLFSRTKQKIIIRKYYSSFIIILITITVISVWLYFVPYVFIYLTIVSTSFLGTLYLLSIKNIWVKNIMFLILLGGVVLYWVLTLQ